MRLARRDPFADSLPFRAFLHDVPERMRRRESFPVDADKIPTQCREPHESQVRTSDRCELRSDPTTKFTVGRPA